MLIAIVVFAALAEPLAGFLTLVAALIATLDLWCAAHLTRVLYWITATSAGVSIVLIGSLGGWRNLSFTLFGTPVNPHIGDSYGHLNVLTFWLLLYIASIPFWRGRMLNALRSHSESSPRQK